MLNTMKYRRCRWNHANSTTNNPCVVSAWPQILISSTIRSYITSTLSVSSHNSIYTHTATHSLNSQPSAPHPNPLENHDEWDGTAIMTLAFSHCSADVPRTLARHCISIASDEAWNRFSNFWDQAIGKSELVGNMTNLAEVGS